jgi:hypothetical protein
MDDFTILRFIQTNRDDNGDIITVTAEVVDKSKVISTRTLPMELFSRNRVLEIALKLYLDTKEKSKSDKEKEAQAKRNLEANEPDLEEKREKDDRYHALERPVLVIIINPLFLVQSTMEEILGVKVSRWDASVTLSNRYTVAWIFCTINGKLMPIHISSFWV